MYDYKEALHNNAFCCEKSYMYKMYHWRFILSLFIFSSVSVFVIVGGQPTTDDNDNVNVLHQLLDSVATLQSEVTQLKNKNEILEAKHEVKVAGLEAKVAQLEAEQPAMSLNNCKSLV